MLIVRRIIWKGCYFERQVDLSFAVGKGIYMCYHVK